MFFFRLSPKAIAITVAAAVVAGALLFAAGPQPIESTVLGANWECTQTAFVFTSCVPRAQHAIPVVQTSRKDAIKDCP